MTFRTNAPIVLGLLLTAACAAAPDVRTAPPATSAVGTSSLPPCAPDEWAPCDETKQKCMGPMVCDGHPEKAKRTCARDADGKCASRLVCE